MIGLVQKVIESKGGATPHDDWVCGVSMGEGHVGPEHNSAYVHDRP